MLAQSHGPSPVKARTASRAPRGRTRPERPVPKAAPAASEKCPVAAAAAAVSAAGLVGQRSKAPCPAAQCEAAVATEAVATAAVAKIGRASCRGGVGSGGDLEG